MKKSFFKGLNYFKKTISSVTQNAVNKTVNILEENQSGEYLKDLYVLLQNKNVDITDEVYNTEFAPLNKYYTEEIQTSNPILYIAVVSFNHKKGAIIEFTYPDKETLLEKEESKNYMTTLCDKENKDINTIEKIYDNINNQLTYLCMPDGAHSLKNDSQFFLIQNFKKILYGISVYRQLQTTPAMKEDDQENTRDCVQKAMCIVSKVPLFGQMASKLSITMLAYFNQESLKDKKIIEDLYNNYKISSMNSWNVNEILASFSLKKLLSLTKDKIFAIMKLAMLEKKILVYSHISNNVCSFIFSFLSLFPCNALFNLDYNKTGSKYYYQCYKPYGLPLKFINSNSILYSLMTLFDLGYLEAKNIKSFFIGTTNPLLLNYKKIEFDCIINIDENKISFNKKVGTSILRMSKKERDVMKLIKKQCIINSGLNNDNVVSGNMVFEETEQKIVHPEVKKSNTFSFGNIVNSAPKSTSLYQRSSSAEVEEDDNDENDNNFEKFQGSDDHIRNIFKEYITNFLSDIALVKYIINSKNTEENDIENKLHNLKQVLSGYNYEFVLSWIASTKNFLYWNYEYDKDLWKFSKHIEDVSDVSKHFENGDHYQGELKYGLLDGQGTLNTFLDGMGYTYVGDFKNGKKHGKGNLSSKDHKYNYDGWWENDEKNGVGTLFDNGDKYTGDFKNDKYCGNGTLCSKNGDIYECEFSDGKPNGLGRVSMANGDVYTGNFLNGNLHGQGTIKYKNGDSYNGCFENNKKCGYGCFIMADGDSYEGDFDNDLYNGEGKLIKKNGEVFKGVYKDGKLIEKLDELKREKEIRENKEKERNEESNDNNSSNTNNGNDVSNKNNGNNINE